jgi:TolA-binding protein
MKTVTRLALCALLLMSCSKSASSQLSDMKAQVDDLTLRVKSLEDDRLKAEKQLIQTQQAMQSMHEQLRNMEDYFNRLQVSQQATPH